MTVELWRCKSCGKWSHAKTRPYAHERRNVLEHASECPPDQHAICCAPNGGCAAATSAVVEVVWCGPFERYVATIDDPTPPPPSTRIGELVEQHHEGPDPALADVAVDEVFQA